MTQPQLTRTQERNRALIVLAFVSALGFSGGEVHAESEKPTDGYEIVVVTAVAALPAPLRTAFEQQEDELIRVTLSHRVKPDASAVDVDRHFVLLDLAAERGADHAGRIESSRRFPRDLDDAVKLAHQQGVRRAGSLPWTLHAHYESMVQAFRSADNPVVAAGALLHYVTDASMPLYVVKERSGRRRGRVFDRTESMPEPPNRREKLLEAVAVLRERLEYEVRVSPTRFAELDEPLDAIFEMLLASFADLVGSRPIDVQDRADEAAAITESRLEAAALLGANLIGTAWIEAGRPSLDLLNVTIAKPAGTPRPRVNPRTGTASASSRFVGSRHSNIYHRSTCSHAKRIKPSNLVAFGRRKLAIDAGRKPCKTCKPGAD